MTFTTLAQKKLDFRCFAVNSHVSASCVFREKTPTVPQLPAEPSELDSGLFQQQKRQIPAES